MLFAQHQPLEEAMNGQEKIEIHSLRKILPIILLILDPNGLFLENKRHLGVVREMNHPGVASELSHFGKVENQDHLGLSDMSHHSLGKGVSHLGIIREVIVLTSIRKVGHFGGIEVVILLGVIEEAKHIGVVKTRVTDKDHLGQILEVTHSGVAISATRSGGIKAILFGEIEKVNHPGEVQRKEIFGR